MTPDSQQRSANPPTEAFFIMSGGRQICCAFYPAAAVQHPLKRSCLLAQPIGHDYIKSHRAHRQIALRLARRGVDVLRFDFTGCGDSEGDLKTAHVDAWMEDVAAAFEELKRRTPSQEIGVVAAGLAASLALEFDAQGAPWSFMALWQPFVRGENWVAHLQQQQSEVESGNAATFRPAEEGVYESVGFAYDEALIADIKKRTFSLNKLPATDRLLLIDSRPVTGHQEFVNDAVSRGLLATYVSLPPEGDIEDDPFKPRVPHDVIQTAVDWIVQ